MPLPPDRLPCTTGPRVGVKSFQALQDSRSLADPQPRMSRPPLLPFPRLLVLLCSLLQWLLLPASGQVLWPLTGQGLVADNGGQPVVVTVDAHLDRLLEINQDAGSWRAVHRLHLSWLDSRAQDAVLTSTEAWYNGSSAASSGCHLTCDASMSFEAGCCDSVWLPHVDLPNMLEYNYQVIPPRWRIWVEPVLLEDGTSSSRVHWTVRLDATWFSPFDFRAWPLEHQHLVLEMQASPVTAHKVQLVLGSMGQLYNTPHTKGVDIAGWWIKKVTPRMYNTSACFQRSNTTFWVLDFASAPGNSTTSAADAVRLQRVAPGDMSTHLPNTTVVTSITADACGDIGNPEGVSQYGPYVLVIDNMMVRDKAFYVLVFIVPLIIVTLMVFVIYAMERHNLEARMGVVVTLVLALSALQFMYNFPPASYLNVVQQLTLTSYVLFALVAIECIITSSIARIHERKRTHEAALVAAGLKSMNASKHRSFATIGGSRLGSGVLDGLSDDDCSSVTGTSYPPASGLFFGSSPAPKCMEPSPFRTLAPPAAERGGPAPPLSPIPEAGRQQALGEGTEPDGPAPPCAPGLVQIQVEPEIQEPACKIGRPRGMGQAVCEGVEWTWPAALKQRSAAAAGAEQAGVSEPPPGPSPAQPPSGRMTQLRQSIGHGRRSVEQLLSNVQGRTRAIRSKMSVDEAYAQLLARRVDIVCSSVLLVSYIIVVTAILAVSSSVGDHKLMLAGTSAPGNM